MKLRLKTIDMLKEEFGVDDKRSYIANDGDIKFKECSPYIVFDMLQWFDMVEMDVEFVEEEGKYTRCMAFPDGETWYIDNRWIADEFTLFGGIDELFEKEL